MVNGSINKSCFDCGQNTDGNTLVSNMIAVKELSNNKDGTRETKHETNTNVSRHVGGSSERSDNEIELCKKRIEF